MLHMVLRAWIHIHTHINMQQKTISYRRDTHTEGKRLIVSNPIIGLMVLSDNNTIIRVCHSCSARCGHSINTCSIKLKTTERFSSIIILLYM